MSRLLTSLCMMLLLTAAPALAQSPTSEPAPATEADVKAILGDWTITGESGMGPFAVWLTMAVEEGKPTGTISSEIQAPTVITDITKRGETLVLAYSFDFEGNAIPAVLTLTPNAEKLDAYFSFADGAFEMAGVGVKTPPAAQ
ncbi:MAG: hypothetical protein DIU54_014790 [Acidobacteriota bacterium]|mgnify:CR=1 FL=1|jgi:hypothetical protein